ncbi:MAG TPA: NUDIX hydrolase [Armatimonadota bacterium]|nr:NUDIX hydrolase [Armatimonadota bacterium]
MYLRSDVIRILEGRYGVPETAVANAEFSAREFGLVEHCLRKERAHDVTLFIRNEHGRFAVIRKPSYPEEVYRPPSGGVEPGEPFEAGAAREAMEETGLEIRLERYLLRVDSRFTCEGRSARWTTHVFLATAVGGTLCPQDRVEIADARWATVTEMVERYRPAMLAMDGAGMRYRVDLQDAALRLLGLADPPAPEAGRTLRRVVPTPHQQAR